MIGGKRVLAVITARGGSKGLPGKNIRPLAGKPLIAWTVAAAKAARHVDRVVITSDDPAIIAAATEAGAEAPFVRPAELARDDTPSMPVLFHALDSLDESFDLVVLLQPTSPLRTGADIDACLDLMLAKDAPAAIGVIEPAKPPFWMFRMDDAGRLVPLMPNPATRRQDLPQVWAANGAVFAADVDWLRKSGNFVTDETVGYAMPVERSIDIDSLLDFRVAELLLRDDPLAE
ncbi:acylneuraminate cytidylyltransferase [Paramagnetospirillum kuznetsovii]|uniref:Acylneuraminate cytidylyltransferase n=2 Tax=Paramagnetospirillum kuznetsovii TaxID=2053833 RepID=A0A364P2Q7_9PROT|nr:acylneuraminate cytidylyltransferase [Paramagnetospirillum kuznetsovii]